MAKRKITVTVDEGLVESVQALGLESLSSVVNDALGAEIERRARAAALRRLLAEWDEQFGPVDPADAAAATAAFDDLDGVAAPSGPAATPTGRARSKGRKASAA
jgi:hypothetical protein